MSKQNTRRLIEGLYRQKFNAEAEYNNLSTMIFGMVMTGRCVG